MVLSNFDFFPSYLQADCETSQICLKLHAHFFLVISISLRPISTQFAVMYTFSHLFCVNWARKSHSIIFGSLGVRFNHSWYSKIANFTYDGSFHAWNSPCEKRRWLFKLLTRRSIKNNISWKLSWKVCQIQLNWGPTIPGKYLCIFVLAVHNSINHSRGFMVFTPHRYPNQVSPNLAGLRMAGTQSNSYSAQNQTGPRHQILTQRVGFRAYFMQSAMVWSESRCLHRTARNETQRAETSFKQKGIWAFWVVDPVKSSTF